VTGKRTRTLGLIAGMVVVLGGFGYLLYGNIGDNIVYFLTPSELLAKGAEAYDQPVRLGGQVKGGSVQWNADALDLRFVVKDADGEIAVHSKGAPPQMFQTEMGVIVEGRLTRSGGQPLFESTNLMVRHSNEYQPPKDGHPKPDEMYKSLIRDES
jgi:cytochrome c-type biogenesis protein CcmE